MRKILLALACLPALAGCQSTSGVTTVNNTLASLAANDIPTACGIVAVAEGYFAQVKATGKLSAAEIADEAKAASAIAVVCNNPPTSIAAAFGTLLNAWLAVQADTTVPGT
jgi:hypothetical protein